MLIYPIHKGVQEITDITKKYPVVVAVGILAVFYFYKRLQYTETKLQEIEARQHNVQQTISAISTQIKEFEKAEKEAADRRRQEMEQLQRDLKSNPQDSTILSRILNFTAETAASLAAERLGVLTSIGTAVSGLGRLLFAASAVAI